MTTEPITVEGIDTLRVTDPYRRNTGGLTTSAIQFDPANRRVWIVQHEPGCNSTAMAFYHNVELYQVIENMVDAGQPEDEDAMREYLEGEEGQRLLGIVADGHEVVWNGNNHVGRMTDEANDAWEELMADLSFLPRSAIESWHVDDWLGGQVAEVLEMYRLTRNSTDEEIAAAETAIEAQAREENVYLVDDVEAWLRNEISRIEDEDEEETE